jgi:hypothetical protein
MESRQPTPINDRLNQQYRRKAAVQTIWRHKELVRSISLGLLLDPSKRHVLTG